MFNRRSHSTSKRLLVLFPLIALLAVPVHSPAGEESPLEIRFDTPPPVGPVSGWRGLEEVAGDFPDRHWESQALPVGNGRLGAMVFGNPWNERIQFNEISLWTGGDNPSGGYTADAFGAYQNFGNIFLQIESVEGAAAAPVGPVNPAGQTPFVAAEGIGASIDGRHTTKWCVEHQGREVMWQVALPEAVALGGYAFTSANDVPARDPRTWRLEGSADGKAWTAIDSHKGRPPFSARHLRKHFPLDDVPAFSHYRFVFAPANDAPHFQVARIELDGVSFSAETRQDGGYSRSLDLRTAIHTTRWEQGGTTYTREVFASGPDEVIAIRLHTSPPTELRGRVMVVGGHDEPVAYDGAEAHLAATLDNDLRKAARLRVLPDDGGVGAAGTHLAWHGTGVTILLAAATDYALDPDANFRSGTDPAATANRQVEAAARRNYDAMRGDHIRQFSELMGRVALELGEPREGDTPARLAAYRRTGAQDPHLEALLFQYGRYLLISSSRGFLPANLQGLWNERNNPPWHSDYHTNINLQMNYWGAEVAALPEMVEPLIHWLLAMAPGSRAATVREFGEQTPGWTMRTSVNIFGGNGWQWNLPASAWLAQHLWEHYAFNGDRDYLAETAWPVLVDVCEFWLDHLVERDGKLVAPNGWSPEHGPREDGVAHDQQIIWDLFTNTLEAAAALGKEDEPFALRVAEARERLLGPQIGSWGQLMEWTTEREELERSHHRHTSHLFAVFPGRQITLHGEPALARAAAVSLEARGTGGDSRRSWTWPWRTALWARLGEPERAGDMIRGLLMHNTLPNFFTSHPPFQIDGNLGIAGAIAETLVQSHTGEVAILPALPPQWPAGSFSGLRARGGFDVDATWNDGALVSAVVRSRLGRPLVLRLPGEFPEITIVERTSGTRTAVHPENGTFRLPTEAGESYEIVLP